MLREAVAIKSVSAWPDTRAEIDKMVNWTADKLRALGTQIELADVGIQTLSDGNKIPLPKVLLGTLGTVSTIFQSMIIIKLNLIVVILVLV